MYLTVAQDKEMMPPMMDEIKSRLLRMHVRHVDRVGDIDFNRHLPVD